MTYQTPVDGEYIAEKQQAEYTAQGIMDAFYIQQGWEIINREGNGKRDLVLRKNGVDFAVEEKYRDEDWGDLLIEFIQDLVSESMGWFYKEKFDILSYVINVSGKPNHVYMVKWDKFKDWYFHYLSEHLTQVIKISKKGYGLTLNLRIKWPDIPSDIYKKFMIGEP